MAQRKIFAGIKLRALREQQKLTQAEFAMRLDISTSYVNQLENNQRPVTAAIMLRWPKPSMSMSPAFWPTSLTG